MQTHGINNSDGTLNSGWQNVSLQESRAAFCGDPPHPGQTIGQVFTNNFHNSLWPGNWEASWETLLICMALLLIPLITTLGAHLFFLRQYEE